MSVSVERKSTGEVISIVLKARKEEGCSLQAYNLLKSIYISLKENLLRKEKKEIWRRGKEIWHSFIQQNLNSGSAQI